MIMIIGIYYCACHGIPVCRNAHDKILFPINNKMATFKAHVFTVIDLGACVYQKCPIRQGIGKTIFVL